MAHVAVLLGAGASVAAGMPTSEAMIDRLLSDFREQAQGQIGAQGRLRLLEFVVYSLRQQAASQGDVDGLDVETMFNAIETLASRRRLSIAPFIASWQPLVEEAERTAAAAEKFVSPEQELARLLETAIQAKAEEVQARVGSSAAFRTLPARGAVETFIRELLGASDAAQLVFAGLAAAVLEALVRILRLERPEKVRYLTPLVDLFRAQERLTIATLNYDLTIETLGDLLETPVDNGMSDWPTKERLQFGAGVSLLKLHGSIDWKLTRHPVVASGFAKLPYESVRYQKGLEPDTPAVIFGAGNKLRAGGPYLALLRDFERSLDDSQALLVIGYSFRDDHVNAILTTWKNTDEARRMVILDKSADRFGVFPEVAPLSLSLGNYLWWLSTERPQRVKLVQSSVADGLPDAIQVAREGWV
jgi:SIR2-like domain